MLKNFAQNIILLTINQNRLPEHLPNNEGHSFLWCILVFAPKKSRTNKKLEAFFILGLKQSLDKGGLQLWSEVVRHNCHCSPVEQKLPLSQQNKY